MMSRDAKREQKVYYYVTRGCWVASYTGPDGKRKVKRLPLASNAEEAAEEFLSLQDAKTTEEPSTESGSSLKPIMATFERQVMSEMRPTTVAIYRQTFGLLDAAGIQTTADVRPSKLLDLRDVLMERGIGATTAHKLLRATRRFLNWSRDAGHVSVVPKIPMPRLRKRSKGRPLTEAEFHSMVGVVDRVYHHHPNRAVGCKRLLWGLWLGGLRLGESLALSWDDREAFHVDWTTYKNPVFVMPDDMDKAGQARVFPMAPEFWALISSVPVENRTGPVFAVCPTKGVGQVMRADEVSDVISTIGKLANVIVSQPRSDTRSTKAKIKYASAHDLRRSFGLTWAQRVNQMQLGALMRHRDPATTSTYYLGHNASMLLDSLWSKAKSATDAGAEVASASQPAIEPTTPKSASQEFLDLPVPEPIESGPQNGDPLGSKVRSVPTRRPREQQEPSVVESVVVEPVLKRAKEVCGVLGVSRWTLRNMKASGVVRGVQIGGQIRYYSEDVSRLTNPDRDTKLDFVTPGAAAKTFGVSARTITRMADSGEVRSVRTPNGHRRVLLEDLQRAFAKQAK